VKAEWLDWMILGAVLYLIARQPGGAPPQAYRV
jgi:hypothetical protein